MCIVCMNIIASFAAIVEKNVENVDGEHFVGNTTVCAKFC